MDDRRYDDLMRGGAEAAAPAIRAAMDEARAGWSFGLRAVTAPIWAAILAIAPYLARAALRAVLWYVSSMTLREAAELLAEHRSRAGPHGP